MATFVSSDRQELVVPTNQNRSSQDRDRIELRGIRATGAIGVLAEEQERAQPFEVDIDIELDASLAGRSDDLEHTVDYGQAVSIATKIVETGGVLLLEKVATIIAHEILGLARVRAATVTVKKLRPPLPHDLTSTAVRVRREQADQFLTDRASTTAYVAMGTNLGDRQANLRFAAAMLPGIAALSGIYETDPVGGPDQDPYLNQVARLETMLTPFELLERCLAIEAAAGRERGIRWGPRTLDLDVLLWGDAAIESATLTVPHPRMWERRFVLEPLSELAPELLPEDWNERLPRGGIKRIADAEQ